MINQEQVESLIKNLPDQKMNRVVKAGLRQTLRDEEVKMASKWSLAKLWKIALVPMIALVLVIGGTLYVKTHQVGSSGVLWALSPSQVLAAEIITKSRERLFQPGTIYHQKTKLYLNGEPASVEYDYWQDISGGSFLNHVTTLDGSRESWQLDDMKVRWDIDVKTREARKDTYIYDELNTLEKSILARNTQVDLAAKFEELVAKGALETKEGKLGTRDVYVVSDTRASSDKYWDILIFDKDTFQLLETYKYKEPVESKKLESIVSYETLESLPVTPELQSKLFSALPVDLAKYKVFSRNFAISELYHADYVEEGNLSVVEPTPVSADQYINYVIPEGWKKRIDEVDAYLEITSPDHVQELSTVKGMSISLNTNTWRGGALDPQTEFGNLKSGNADGGIHDISEVIIDSKPAMRYYIDYEGHQLVYYVIYGGYGWDIRFSTASLSEEKKYQKVIDQFLASVKFKNTSASDNNWRTYNSPVYDGPGVVTFQYPGNWPDLRVDKLSSNGQRIVADGVFELVTGTYSNQKLGRTMTFEEYRNEILVQESNGQEVEYSLGGLKGVMFTSLDSEKPNSNIKHGQEKVTTRILLVSNQDDSFLYNLTFINDGVDFDKVNSIIDPILATFKFE